MNSYEPVSEAQQMMPKAEAESSMYRIVDMTYQVEALNEKTSSILTMLLETHRRAMGEVPPRAEEAVQVPASDPDGSIGQLAMTIERQRDLLGTVQHVAEQLDRL